eukprot:5218942-Amphidinium_carterae.1
MSLLWLAELLLLCWSCAVEMVAEAAILPSIGAEHSIALDNVTERPLLDVVAAPLAAPTEIPLLDVVAAPLTALAGIPFMDVVAAPWAALAEISLLDVVATTLTAPASSSSGTMPATQLSTPKPAAEVRVDVLAQRVSALET